MGGAGGLSPGPVRERNGEMEAGPEAESLRISQEQGGWPGQRLLRGGGRRLGCDHHIWTLGGHLWARTVLGTGGAGFERAASHGVRKGSGRWWFMFLRNYRLKGGKRRRGWRWDELGDWD